MKDSIFISRIFSYATPSEEAKGKFSVGMAVASRLNGDEDLVATFDEEQQADGDLKVGFLTFREKFMTQEDAEEYRKRMSKKYPVASVLDPRKWSWGRVDEETTQELNSGAVVHMVRYKNRDVEVPKEAVNAKAKQGLEFKGKVTEPVT